VRLRGRCDDDADVIFANSKFISDGARGCPRVAAADGRTDGRGLMLDRYDGLRRQSDDRRPARSGLGRPCADGLARRDNDDAPARDELDLATAGGSRVGEKRDELARVSLIAVRDSSFTICMLRRVHVYRSSKQSTTI